MAGASGKMKVDTQNRVSTFFISVRIKVEARKWEVKKEFLIENGARKIS